MTRRASPVSRYGDFAGLLLILAGFLGYLWTGGALAQLGRRAGAPGGTTYGAVAEADRLLGFSQVSLAMAVAGVLVLVVTAVVQRRERQTRSRVAQ